jgi:hypothetical protein
MAQLRVHVQARPGKVHIDRAAAARFVRTDPKIQRDMARRGDNMMSGWRGDVPPGQLSSTFRMQPGTRAGGGVTCIAGVEGRTPQLGFLLFGTRPHLILPRVKKVLRFVGRGSVVFAKRVNHPGTRKNDFITKNLPRAAQ